MNEKESQKITVCVVGGFHDINVLMRVLHSINVFIKITFHKSVMFDYYIISYIRFIVSSFIYVKLLAFRVRAENLLMM